MPRKIGEQWQALRERLRRYTDRGAAMEWAEVNWERTRDLFEIERLNAFIFEPLFGQQGRLETHPGSRAHRVITQVAIANAALAGLPGKLGVGVYVTMALEAYMAVAIGRDVGVRLNEPREIWKYFGLLGGVSITILWGFRHLLGFAFSLFNMVAALPATVLAEFTVTTLVGLLFWIGFEEVAKDRSFSAPAGSAKRFLRHGRELIGYQKRAIGNALSLKNLKEVAQKLYAWFSGDMVLDHPRVRGQLVAPVAMAVLLGGRHEAFEGPLGELFLQAIRDRYPALSASSAEEIAGFMSEYDVEQLGGVVNLVKGRMFELLVEKYENEDNDGWGARLHDDPTYPGSDIVFSNDLGEEIEVSLKATSSVSYVEEAVLRYPEIPILTTAEVGGKLEDLPGVLPYPISNEALTDVTQENFNELLTKASELGRADAAEAVGAGTGVAVLASVWPFAVAFGRKRITLDQLQQACMAILPEGGKMLALRLALAFALGPIYAWYILARVVMEGTPEPPEETAEPPRRISHRDVPGKDD